MLSCSYLFKKKMKKKPLENYAQINRNHKLEKIASAIDQHKTTLDVFLDLSIFLHWRASLIELDKL